MENIIKIDKMSFKYKDKFIFKDFSLNIEKGSFVSIIGTNGSGKSTLIKILTGLLNYDGYINIDSYNLNKSYLKQIRRKIGVVFDNPDNHFVSETVIDDLAFSLENLQYSKEEIDKLIIEISKVFNLNDILYKSPYELTNSEKQKVAIAGSLIFNPKILLLDEALHQLNPKCKKEILDILKRYQEEKNLTIIMITHDLEDTLYSDRMIILEKGKIYLDGKLEEVYYQKEKLDKLNLNVPFIIKLSYKLIKEKIIDRVYTNILELVDELWQ